MKRKGTAILILLSVLVAAVLVGNDAISSGEVIKTIFGGGTSAQRVIVFQVRLPRVFAAMSVGAALSVSGFLLQGALDNRIASSGILGINNGAGLFVLLSAILFPYQAGVKCLFAFIGAILVTLSISLLSLKTGMSKTSVILSGVAVSASCVSVVDVIISVRPETVADKVAFQIGGFATVQPLIVFFTLPLIVLGIVAAYYIAPGLDLLALGDETAHGLGLSVRLFRYGCVVIVALLSGAAICLCGLISFVGLIVPNVIRMCSPVKARDGVFFCSICGAAFVLFCDTVAKRIVFPYELPCGLILSLIGAPFLIVILVKKRKRLGID